MDLTTHSKDEHEPSSGSGANVTAADRLRSAVGVAAEGRGSRQELEAAARALVAELRGRDAAPEQVLVQMKALLAEAGLRAGYALTDAIGGDHDQATLYRDIITWSIRCYYEDCKEQKPPV
jgi:hypothetical protein